MTQWLRGIASALLVLTSIWLFAIALQTPSAHASMLDKDLPSPTPSVETPALESVATVPPAAVSRGAMLVSSFTVFLLAVFVGFEIITKVPPTLHTPLMSGSNAISGITIVGAILTAGHSVGGIGAFFGMLAVIFAAVNVAGGFLVTHRMLMMFKKR